MNDSGLLNVVVGLGLPRRFAPRNDGLGGAAWLTSNHAVDCVCLRRAGSFDYQGLSGHFFRFLEAHDV